MGMDFSTLRTLISRYVSFKALRVYSTLLSPGRCRPRHSLFSFQTFHEEKPKTRVRFSSLLLSNSAEAAHPGLSFA